VSLPTQAGTLTPLRLFKHVSTTRQLVLRLRCHRVRSLALLFRAACGILISPARTGVYSIGTQLAVSKSITFQTQGRPGSPACSALMAGCAVLRANTALNAPWGMLLANNVNGIQFQNIVLDGNRFVRLGTSAAQSCAAGDNAPGFNAGNHGCTDCSFTGSVSMFAICGTGTHVVFFCGLFVLIAAALQGLSGRARRPLLLTQPSCITATTSRTICGAMASP
jgi:hypothetical protein